MGGTVRVGSSSSSTTINNDNRISSSSSDSSGNRSIRIRELHSSGIYDAWMADGGKRFRDWHPQENGDIDQNTFTREQSEGYRAWVWEVDSEIVMILIVENPNGTRGNPPPTYVNVKGEEYSNYRAKQWQPYRLARRMDQDEYKWKCVGFVEEVAKQLAAEGSGFLWSPGFLGRAGESEYHKYKTGMYGYQIKNKIYSSNGIKSMAGCLLNSDKWEKSGNTDGHGAVTSSRSSSNSHFSFFWVGSNVVDPRTGTSFRYRGSFSKPHLKCKRCRLCYSDSEQVDGKCPNCGSIDVGAEWPGTFKTRPECGYVLA